MAGFIADLIISPERQKELAAEKLRTMGADPGAVADEKLGFVLFDDGMDSFYGPDGTEQIKKLAGIVGKATGRGLSGLRIVGFAGTTEKGFERSPSQAAKLAGARAHYVWSLIDGTSSWRGALFISPITDENIVYPGFSILGVAPVTPMARRVDIYPGP